MRREEKRDVGLPLIFGMCGGDPGSLVLGFRFILLIYLILIFIFIITVWKVMMWDPLYMNRVGR